MSLSALSLLQTTLVQLPCVRVVIVDGGNGRILLFKFLAGVEYKHGQVLQDDELELGDVVRVHPVLCGLTNEVLLLAACARVTSDWVSAGSYLVVELREIDDSGIVVVLEERPCAQSRGKHGLQVPIGLLVVLLDDFLEPRVVQLRELGQVVYVRNDVRKIFLQQQVFILSRRIRPRALVAVGRLCPRDRLAHFLLASRNPANDLLAFHLLEGKDLVQLLLQLVDEALLIFLVPFLLGLAAALLEALLELVVGDVVVVPVFDEGAAKLLAEPARVVLA